MLDSFSFCVYVTAFAVSVAERSVLGAPRPSMCYMGRSEATNAPWVEIKGGTTDY